MTDENSFTGQVEANERTEIEQEARRLERLGMCRDCSKIGAKEQK